MRSLPPAALDHRNPDVRRWTVRLLGDGCRVGGAIASRLGRLAAEDASPLVRRNSRVPLAGCRPAAALPIVRQLVLRDADAADPHIPLLLWWAVERQGRLDAAGPTTEFFASAAAWKTGLVRDGLGERLVRRYAGPGQVRDRRRLCPPATVGSDEAIGRDCWRRWTSASGSGLAARSLRPAGGLEQTLAGWWHAAPDDPALIGLLVRLGRPEAVNRATMLVVDWGACPEVGPHYSRHWPTAARGRVRRRRWGSSIGSNLLASELAAVAAWQVLGNDEQAANLIAAYPKLKDPVRSRARSTLLGRKAWAGLFLGGVDKATIPPTDVTVDDLQLVTAHHDPTLDETVRKHWGTVRGPTPGERLADIRRINNDLRAGPGDPRTGRALFTQHCGACHKLFNDGVRRRTGFEHANRFDRDDLLVNIVDPSGVIRKEFLSFTATMSDCLCLPGSSRNKVAAGHAR